ncbi:hypothetical protein IW261DRAFT_1564632 [Armillaria novae-zelandiae]|uniref:Uncharacterized protein n=1 Tax=Armillaria novae-zelandiae TaxID=153914 RepID=A0AA39UEH4_9AGAR|nr:hypothetical protein IW261DRAFT_1564632 [Armillaria novae-zelandiae]
MCEPVIQQDPAILRAEADRCYVDAALQLEDLVRLPPPHQHSPKIDTWLVDVLAQWGICQSNHKLAGITKSVFHKLEYSVIMAVARVDLEWVKKSRLVFNELGKLTGSRLLLSPMIQILLLKKMEDYRRDQAVGKEGPVTRWPFSSPAVPTAEPSLTPQLSKSTSGAPCHSSSPRLSFSQQILETFSVPLPLSPSRDLHSIVEQPPDPSATIETAPFLDVTTVPSLPKGLVSGMRPRPRMISTRPVVLATGTMSITPGPSTFSFSFIPDPDSPLHIKPASPFKTGPPVSTKKLPKKVYGLQTVNAASRPQVIPGRAPLQREESQSLPKPFLLDEGPVDSLDFDDDTCPLSPQDNEVMSLELTIGQMVSVGAASPLPRLFPTARRRKFVSPIEEVDFTSPPAIVVRPTRVEESLDDICHSYRARRSPPSRGAPKNPKAIDNPVKKRLQKLAQEKVQRRLQEEVRNLISSNVTRKRRTRPVSIDVVEEPSLKKPRMLEPVAEDDEVCPTPAVRKRGPGPTKPPLVALGVGGGGFGEVPMGSLDLAADGISHIGVLEIEADYGLFVKVDGRLWNKDVAAFVGERYTNPCDQCKSRGTHCRKFLTHTSICICCHYSKAACTVDRAMVLNPIDHLPCKAHHNDSSFYNTFQLVEERVSSIWTKARQFLAGLDILDDANVILRQVSHLRSDMSSAGRVGTSSLLPEDEENLSAVDLESGAGP